MIIKSIDIKNFKSIEQLTLTFDNGLNKIIGNTGAGKTSIGEAIIFGLFGSIRDKKKADLIRWGERSCEVTINVMARNHNLTIYRKLASTDVFNVMCDGDPLIFTNKADLQAQLENHYYDATRNTLETLCLISFNNFKSLTKLNASETRQFLDQMLGMHVLTRYAEIGKQCRKEVDEKFNDVDDKISIINSKIAELKRAKSTLLTENVDELLCDVSEQYNKLRADIEQFKADAQPHISQLRTQYMQENARLASVIERGKQKKHELSLLASRICPTCHAQISDAYMNDLETQRAELQREYVSINERCESLKKQESDKMREMETHVAQMTQSLNALNERMMKLQNEKRLNDYISANDADYSVELQSLFASLSEIERDITDWNDLINILSNDVRASIIKQYVPIVNNAIASLIVDLNQPFAMKLTDDFKVEISYNGLIVPISNLSTGQSKTMDMIIILAIVKTLISSISFNVFFLDELMQNMDAELRNNCCDVLREFAKNRCIFVINHAELENKYFDKSIVATLDNTTAFGTSRYKIIEKNLMD